MACVAIGFTKLGFLATCCSMYPLFWSVFFLISDAESRSSNNSFSLALNFASLSLFFYFYNICSILFPITYFLNIFDLLSLLNPLSPLDTYSSFCMGDTSSSSWFVTMVILGDSLVILFFQQSNMAMEILSASFIICVS